MAATSCRNCGAETNAFLCRADSDELEQAFGDLPALLHDLVTRIVGESRVYRANSKPRAKDEVAEELAELDEEYAWRRARVPAHLRTKDARVTLPSTAAVGDRGASELLSAARNTLTTWARHVAESRGARIALPTGATCGPVCAGHVHDFTPATDDATAGCGLYADPDTGAMLCDAMHCAHDSCRTIRHGELTGTASALVRWFLLNRESLRYDEAAADIYREITDLRDTVARAVDRSPTAVFAGPCVDCGAEMYRDAGADSIVCDGRRRDQVGCGRQYTLGERTDWLLDELEDALAPLVAVKDFATGVLGITWPPAQSVQGWIRQGRLPVRTVNRDGVELFRGGDVMDLVRAYKPHAYAPRGKSTAA